MKNYKVSHRRPEISADEAGKMADFNQQMEAFQNASTGGSNVWMITRSLVVFVALVGLVFFMIKRKSKEVVNSESNALPQKSELVEVPDQVEEEKDFESIQPEAQKEITAVPEVTPAPSSETIEIEEEEKSSIQVSEDIEPAGFIEAAPVDGFPALYQYFDEHLIYPPDMLEEGLEGNVIVKFMIDTDGLPGEVLIEKSLHEKLDSTAIALIRNMPLWKPATLNGKPIPSTHRVPLFFQINQTEN